VSGLSGVSGGVVILLRLVGRVFRVDEVGLDCLGKTTTVVLAGTPSCLPSFTVRKKVKFVGVWTRGDAKYGVEAV
jgi:hypothetical protein